MFINERYSITNTPLPRAGYNTWPYLPRQSAWYQRVPTYYTDHNGVTRVWDSWEQPRQVAIPGGLYNGTPTRTQSYYTQNTIIEN